MTPTQPDPDVRDVRDPVARSVMWLCLVVIALIVLVSIGGFIFASAFVQGQHRQDCRARIEAQFEHHLADALSKKPASAPRQDFLDRMKADSARLKESACG